MNRLGGPVDGGHDGKTADTIARPCNGSAGVVRTPVLATRRVILGLLAAAAATFAVVSAAALESNEVVIVRTFDPDGRARDTRTWIADDAGFAWVEAANPERPFLRQIEARPDIELVRAGRTRRCRAEALPNPSGHARIRRMLADRYGWADCWIGMLADTSRSIAVRLACT